MKLTFVQASQKGRKLTDCDQQERELFVETLQSEKHGSYENRLTHSFKALISTVIAPSWTKEMNKNTRLNLMIVIV